MIDTLRIARRNVIAMVAAAVCLLLLLSTRADAHPLDMGYLRIDAGETVAITLDLDVNVAAQILHVEPMAIDASVVAAKASVLAELTYRMVPPRADDQPCRWTAPSAQLRGRSVSLSEKATCAKGAVTWVRLVGRVAVRTN